MNPIFMCLDEDFRQSECPKQTYWLKRSSVEATAYKRGCTKLRGIAVKLASVAYENIGKSEKEKRMVGYDVKGFYNFFFQPATLSATSEEHTTTICSLHIIWVNILICGRPLLTDNTKCNTKNARCNII